MCDGVQSNANQAGVKMLQVPSGAFEKQDLLPEIK